MIELWEWFFYLYKIQIYIIIIAFLILNGFDYRFFHKIKKFWLKLNSFNLICLKNNLDLSVA